MTGNDQVTPLPLMALASGFWSFKTFAAAVELELFTLLAGGREVTLADAVGALGIEDRPADLLLAACASLGLLEKHGDRYRNAPVAEAFLVTGAPSYFGGLVRYLDQREYPAWHKVVDALRTNRPVTWNPGEADSLFSPDDPVMTELFWKATHSLSVLTAATLADSYDFTSHRRLLDVGGGSGAFPIELCRHPRLTATVYDLPHMCRLAEPVIAQAGLGDRIAMRSGDFFQDADLPGGHDVILLSMIMHDWDEATDRALLKKCYAALAPGGVVMICELMLDPRRSGPPEAALMGMNMLVETAGGKNYSEDEYVAWLHGAGFQDVGVIRFAAAGANGVVVGRKPGSPEM